MGQRFKTAIWLPLLLVITLVTPGLCGFIPESHACCQGHAAHSVQVQQVRANPDESCCFISTARAAISQQVVLDLPDGETTGALPAPPALLLHHLESRIEHGLLAQSFVADQSGRHKLLEVWLN